MLILERSEGGDLQAIREVFDRLDGRPPQAIDYGNVSVEVLSDHELFAIIRGGITRTGRRAKLRADLGAWSKRLNRRRRAASV